MSFLPRGALENERGTRRPSGTLDTKRSSAYLSGMFLKTPGVNPGTAALDPTPA